MVLAVRILAVGPGAAGYVGAAYGAGCLLGGVAAVFLLGRRLAVPSAAAALTGAAALRGLASASTVPVATLPLVILGPGRSLQSVAAATLLQRSTPLDAMVSAYALIESVRDLGASIPVVEMGILRNIEIFATLSVPSLETLAREATYQRVQYGTEIITEGDAGESYYGITRGSVLVTQGARTITRMHQDRASARSHCSTRSHAPRPSPRQARRSS